MTEPGRFIHKANKPKPKPKTGRFIHKRNSTGQYVGMGVTPLGSGQIGKSQFDSFNDPVALLRNLQAVRAERQPFSHQAANAILGGLASGLLTAGETVSHILDIPSNIRTTADYFSKDENIHAVESSALATAFKEAKEWLLNEYMPIYKKDPSKMIDFNDSAFYWEAFRGVLDSAVGFGFTGMGAGAAVKAIGAGLRLARLSKYTSIIGKGLNATGKALETGVAGRLTAAYITNFGEGKMMALELYEKATKENYELYIDKYKDDNEGKSPSTEELQEFDHQSRVNAGKQANVFMMRNKLFIASDYLQLNRMFRSTGFGPTSKLIKPPSFKEFAKSQLAAGPKEALEEIGQNVIQMEGLFETRRILAKKGYVPSDKELEDMSMLERFSEFAMSEQALLEGAMGFFGGPVQYAITQAPFEGAARKLKMEHITSQSQQFIANKEYIDQTLYKEVTKKLSEESAADQLNSDPSEVKEINDGLSFSTIAMRNFAMNTTSNLKEQMNSLKETENVSPETIKNIDKKLEQLDKLEVEYMSLQKYSTADQIMTLNQQKKYKEGLKNLFSQDQKEIEANIIKRITDYNSVFETNLSYGEYLANQEDLPSHFVDFMNESELVQFNNEIKSDVKKVTKQIMLLDTAIEQFKNSNSRAVMEYIKDNVMTPSVLTEDKVKMLRLARTKVKGEYVKDYIDIQISTLQAEFDNVIDNEGIEEQGGVDKIVAKTKADNVKSEKITSDDINASESDGPSMQDMFGEDTQAVYESEISGDLGPQDTNPSDVQITPEEYNASDEQINSVVDAARMGVLPTNFIGDMLDSKVEAKHLAEEDAKIMKDQLTADNLDRAIVEGRTPQDFKQGVQVNEAAATNEDISDAQNWNDDSVDTMAKDIISKSQTVKPSTNTETDVKISFNNKKSPKFMAFLNSNESKKGATVEYVIDQQVSPADALTDYKSGNMTETLLNNLAIKVVVNNDPENYTYLFRPNKLASGKWGNAAIAERQLRGEIIEAIRAGERPMGTIVYQYSGAFNTDGTPKSILELNDFESAKDVKLMYVNKEGHLYDAKNKEINPDYNNVITVKRANTPWAGALFTEVKSPNGDKIPMKLNLRKLSKNEVGLIIGIYTNMISPAEKGKVNFKDSLMNESTELYDLLPQEDKNFLGENVKVSEVLDHLIFNGTKTLNNPATQVYYNKGVLYFGKDSMTVEEMKDMSKLVNFEKFLGRFKSRTVSIDKLKNAKYKAFVLDNQIINTDVAIDESGNIFQSDESNSSNPKNRFKTKAIYVSNSINKTLQKSNKKLTIAEKKDKIMKKVKEVSIGDKVVTKEQNRIRDNMQAKIDKLNKKDC